MAQAEAREMGYDQILWLFGPEKYVTEAGASNFFVVWRNKETNKVELVTATLEDKMILNGVTRKSVLEFAKQRLSHSKEDLEGLEVVERRYTMDEIEEAYNDGRLLEAFASGTAVSL